MLISFFNLTEHCLLDYYLETDVRAQYVGVKYISTEICLYFNEVGWGEALSPVYWKEKVVLAIEIWCGLPT